MLFVDTSVWSLALRRDEPHGTAEVRALRMALETGGEIVSTGIVLQELLQGFSGARAGEAIIARFAAIPFVTPDRSDHIAAAALRSTCRRKGVQLGTIDALLAQLCIRHQLSMLTADLDFTHAAKVVPLQLYRAD